MLRHKSIMMNWYDTLFFNNYEIQHCKNKLTKEMWRKILFSLIFYELSPFSSSGINLHICIILLNKKISVNIPLIGDLDV